MDKMVYFAAGPSKIPDQVLERVKDELLDYRGTGVSVMELSHRSATFKNIMDDAEAKLRQLLRVPDNYKVLFMQGGATGQFAAVPLNLRLNGKADYFVTGVWSKKAAAEARKYLDVQLVLPSTERFTGIAPTDQWSLRPDADYVYYCDNETVHGVEFPEVPDTGSVPLVADMSSNILTRTVDVSKFAVILAGAQKNMGPAGVTVVIVRDDLLDRASDQCPSILHYSSMAANESLLNTPPCFNIYVLGKVLEWVLEQGGVEEMERRSRDKSAMIYKTIDESQDFYRAAVEDRSRSRTTVTLRISRGEHLEKQFLLAAEKAGLTSLKGHRSVGGIRAALFNAITVEQTGRLAEFMRHFAAENSA